MMLILNQESIRDVIAFPKNQNAICPLTNAPGETDQKALDELQIAIRTKQNICNYKGYEIILVS